MSYWLTKLDKLPPNVCRLLAREPHQRKQARNTQQIAQHSGLSVQTVRRLSKMRSWKNVTVGQMQQFKVGCGINPGTECLQVGYLKRSFGKGQTPLYHLRRLMKKRKDPRMERFISKLLKP